MSVAIHPRRIVSDETLSTDELREYRAHVRALSEGALERLVAQAHNSTDPAIRALATTYAQLSAFVLNLTPEKRKDE
jgi:hypothetical protein